MTGLLRVDGTAKAWGKSFQELAARYSGTHIAPVTIGSRPALDWEACITNSDNARQYSEQYFKAFLADEPRWK